MKFDTAKISGFEEMSSEEKLKAILEFELEDDSDEVKKLKNSLSKANSEAAEFKRKLHEKLTDEEKAKAEAAEKQRELTEKYEALLKKNTITENAAKYVALGMDAKLAAETAEASFNGESEKVFENLTKFKSELEKSIRADELDKMKRPNGRTDNKPKYTKEDVAKMSYSELAKLKEEDKDLYDELMK